MALSLLLEVSIISPLLVPECGGVSYFEEDVLTQHLPNQLCCVLISFLGCHLESTDREAIRVCVCVCV